MVMSWYRIFQKEFKLVDHTAVFVVLALIILALIGGILFLARGDEDDWRCVRDHWEAHGRPFTPKPTRPCGVGDE